MSARPLSFPRSLWFRLRRGDRRRAARLLTGMECDANAIDTKLLRLRGWEFSSTHDVILKSPHQTLT